MTLAEGNKGTLRTACPIASLFTTNPILTDLGLNPDLCGEKRLTA